MAVFRSGIDLLATIIIPASLLAYWNLNTQTILKRRAKIHIRNRAKYDTERCGSVTDQGMYYYIKIHSNLDKANKSVRPFLFTISRFVISRFECTLM